MNNNNIEEFACICFCSNLYKSFFRIINLFVFFKNKKMKLVEISYENK